MVVQGGCQDQMAEAETPPSKGEAKMIERRSRTPVQECAEGLCQGVHCRQMVGAQNRCLALLSLSSGAGAGARPRR